MTKPEMNVKRTFFVTQEEAKRLREVTGDSYIDHQSPHFELEDGTIIWGKIGYPGQSERWFAK